MNFLWVHLGLILLGLAGLLTAVSSAMMYLLQSAQLKSKHPPGKMSLMLPSLESLDRVHFISLSWGTLLFSLGILSGVIWAEKLSELGQILGDKKVILSFVTGLMYWGIFTLRVSSIRRGQKIALGTLFVFILLFMTIVVSHDMTRFSGRL